jgi:hypothetical protein
MARDDVAEALRWAREIRPGTLRRYGGASGSGGPSGFALDRGPSERPEHPAPRHGGAEEAISAGNRPRRVLLLDRYERTRERLGSRLRADGRRTGRRRVARQRHEDLDRGSAQIPPRDSAVPDLPARRAGSTRRPQPADTGLLDPRHDGHPDPAAHRRARLQRGHYGGCGGAGWDGPRQHRRRLETGHIRACLRAERTGAIPQHVPAFRGAGPRARPRPRREGEGRGRRPGGAAVDAAPDVPLGGRRAGGGGRPRGRGRARQGSGDRVRARGRRGGAAARPVRVSLARRLQRAVAEAITHAPAFTLRGGTSEILRSIVARGLGVR